MSHHPHPMQVVILVVDQQQRPDIPRDPASLPGRSLRCPDHYVELMQQCWATDPAQRPSFERVISHLRCAAAWLFLGRPIRRAAQPCPERAAPGHRGFLLAAQHRGRGGYGSGGRRRAWQTLPGPCSRRPRMHGHIADAAMHIPPFISVASLGNRLCCPGQSAS